MTNEELMQEFDAIKKETLDVVNVWKTKKPNGWDGMYEFLYELVGEIVELVEVAQGVAKEKKESTVIAAVKYAYREVNPDLPWIPEPIETKIEEWLIDNAVPTLIRWLVKTYNKHGIFSHGE